MSTSLGIGTVQFGSDYGISNKSGITTSEEVAKILAIAAHQHLRFLDTAPAYNCEIIVGNSIPASHSFSIVTKTPVFSSQEITEVETDLLESSFNQSLENLKQLTLYGLLVHHAGDILKKGGHLLLEKMQDLKHRGKVNKIGVSVYTSREIDEVMDKFPIDLIQLPVNVLDQRLLLSGHLEKLGKANIEIHARSVFLQGLLLMDPITVPSYFDSIRQHLRNYHRILRLNDLTPVQAALGFVTGLTEVDAVICGVNSHLQLQEICSSATPCRADFFAEFALSDEDIINPSLWRL